MEPTPRIERNTCTLIELVTLVCVIEAERWVASNKPEAQAKHKQGYYGRAK